MSVRKSLAITSVENNIHTILSLIMMVAISRLLSPDEIGIHVIGASIAMLAAELKAFGMGGYLVREKDINSIKVRTTFTVSMLFAFTLGATLIITSSIIADFYSDQRLVPVLMLFSIGFFVAPFSIVTSAVLTRNFEFGKLSIVRLSEVLMSAVTTLILIYFDFGYISLAIGTAVGNISSTVLFVIFRPNIVSYLPYFSDLNVVLKSGFFTSFAALIRRGETVSPELIIGKMADISGAALFSRGMGFIKFSSSLVLGMISPVVAPYLAKSHREGEILADSYIKVNLLVGGICWPILAVAAVFAEQAIILMFGGQWTAAAPIASILAIWALLGMFYVNFEVLLLTIGKEKYTFFYQIILSIVTVILCIGAALIDSALVPFALIGSGILKVLMQAILFKKFLGISIFSYLWQLKQSILVTIACFTIALFMKYITTHLALNAFYSIIILAIAMSIFWLICIFIFKHPLKSELATVVTAAIKVWKAKKKQ